MALTRIKTGNILDGQVFERDLADGAVTFDKFQLTDNGNPGDVLTVDAFGNLLFAPASGTATTLGALADVDVAGVTNEQVLSYDAGNAEWIPVTIPGLGSSSNTYIVDNIAARDALTPAEADMAFVRSGTSGEWEMYLYDSGFPTNPPWVLIATQDSARTDANTLTYTIAYTEPSASPITIGNISQNSRVTQVVVDVITDFNDAGAAITVGDAGDASRLLSNAFIDLSEIGTYVVNVDYIYTSATDTDILLYFNFGTSTTGQCKVSVTYV